MRSNGLGRGRFAKGISLLGLSLGIALLPSAAFGSCVTMWERCRGDADRAFWRGEVGVIRYSLLLDGCDISYGVCSIGKTKDDGK